MNGALMTSASPEWYTPPAIIERVIRALGAIDLDPCAEPGPPFNVPAAEHYTEAIDGLGCPWHGRVYMNPPYGRAIGRWVGKLAAEYAAGRASCERSRGATSAAGCISRATSAAPRSRV